MGWVKFAEKLGNKAQLVEDYLFFINTKLLKKLILECLANSIKVNLIGILKETLGAIEIAKKFCNIAVVSHRSGETEDTIADISVATNTNHIKIFSASSIDRYLSINY